MRAQCPREWKWGLRALIRLKKPSEGGSRKKNYQNGEKTKTDLKIRGETYKQQPSERRIEKKRYPISFLGPQKKKARSNRGGPNHIGTETPSTPIREEGEKNQLMKLGADAWISKNMIRMV